MPIYIYNACTTKQLYYARARVAIFFFPGDASDAAYI